MTFKIQLKRDWQFWSGEWEISILELGRKLLEGEKHLDFVQMQCNPIIEVIVHFTNGFQSYSCNRNIFYYFAHRFLTCLFLIYCELCCHEHLQSKQLLSVQCFICLCHSFKLGEFWPITFKMLSVKVVKRAVHECILFFLHTKAKFCFLFPFFAFK